MLMRRAKAWGPIAVSVRKLSIYL